MDKKPHLHDGHRERMRERFLATDSPTLQEHELLEMLLFYTNARGNTNDTAHSLIEAFGSFEAVMEADMDALCAVGGIGQKSALHLRLISHACKQYMIAKITPSKKEPQALDSTEKLVSFLAARFLGAQKELAVALLINNAMMPIDCFPVGDGTVSSLSLSVRNIAERAYAKHAAGVILAHNHPAGIAVPSTEDVKVTHHLKEALSLLEIPLFEHFVFAGNSYAQIINEITNQAADAKVASPLFEIMKQTLQGDGKNGR